MLASELEVARFSGWTGEWPEPAARPPGPVVEVARLKFLSEGAIKDALLSEIRAAAAGESIAIAVFYLSDRDVIDVIPFAAKDGTQGAYLRLGPSGRLALTAVSQSKLGKAMVIFVNGRQIADLHIDRRIEDGILPIPSGLTALTGARGSRPS